MNKIYRRIRELREDHDWSQAKVGKMLNMSQTGYCQYEIGKNDIPTEVLIKLACIYNVSVDYILGLTNNPNTYERTTPIDVA